MASFSDGVITNKGNDLKAKTDAGVTLELLRLVMGDGVNPPETDPMTLTSLVNELKAFDINSFQFLGSGRTQIRTILSNAGLATGFYAKEVGLIALDPDEGEILYSYASADPADWIPPDTEAFQQIFDMIALTGNASSITITLDPNVANLTMADMQDHEAKQLDPTDTNVDKEKHLSNVQAKKWEDHGNDTLLHMGKNLLINGSLDIWQRGVSFLANGGIYTADRWEKANLNTVLQSTDLPPTVNCTYSAVVDNGGASLSSFLQGVELARQGYGGYFSSENKITVQFWQKAAIAGENITFDLIFRDISGSGTNQVVLINDIIGTTTTDWQLLSKTYSLPGIEPNVSNFCVDFALSFASTAGTIKLAQIQLEAGEVATDFEYRLPGVELALCQRYYQATLDNIPADVAYNSTTNLRRRSQIFFPVKMRTIPTVTFNTGGNWTPTLTASTGGLYWTGDSDSALNICNVQDFTADAEL